MKICNLLLASLPLAACGGQEHNQKENAPPPNIIYILADDLGYGDVKALNPDSKIPTPHLDRIIHEGVHFTDAHSNSSVCAPTRYGILTGCYAFRTHLKRSVIYGYSPPLIDPGRATIGTFLQENGYKTAFIGKWHLGLDWSRKDWTMPVTHVEPNQFIPMDFDDNVDYEGPVRGGPSDLGFDYSFFMSASLDMSPYCYIHNDMVVEEPKGHTEGQNEREHGRGMVVRSGKIADGFDIDQTLPVFTDTANSFIKNHYKDNKPFFLYLSLTAPHTPWVPLDEYENLSNAGLYGDFVVMVDNMVGRVLSTLDQLDLSKNTLVIFTSDNGADWFVHDIDETGHRANYNFRGQKGDIYEGGHRVPFLARWEGVIPAGSRSDQIMCTTDLFATLAGLLGKPLPPRTGEDSFDFWPAFIGKDESPIRNEIIHHSMHGYYSIRAGKWKYTPHLGSGGRSLPRFVQPVPGQPAGTLYNMEKDPGETVNLYDERPDIVIELQNKLETIKRQGYSRPDFE